ncbi:hypothetical protein [Xenorhabdus sp. IM139775]|uniref:hypothetical protein n=1 Tax=Xenorhabdus sp. IM139775 TaxID=3025876 RepID=UPI0023599F26|nr:hypothetical protein [Xenorhabdus sp. IM139775]MDC9592954.1 hypothetical protein [Xenorhabdus sp. IM139775]
MKNNYLEWFYRPVWQQLVLQQLLIISLLLGFYFLVWQKNRHEIHVLQNNIKQQQHHAILFQQKLAELPSLPETQQQIQRMAANLAQNSDLSLKNASSENVPAQNTPILKRLHMPLIDSGSQLMEWKSLKENEQVFWHIVLSLNYGQFLHFLSEIQKLQPPLLIKHIAITPTDIPADNNLTVRMVFSDVTLPDLSETALPTISLPDPADKEKP